MQLQFAERVHETSTTAGTGPLTLAGAVTGCQSFAAIGDGKQCFYMATDGTNWERGIGTYTAAGTSLSRDTILASSNAGAAVAWAGGTLDVFNDVAAALLAMFAHDPTSYSISGPADVPQRLNNALLAIGAQTIANGNWALAMGGYARATGNYATALGNNSYAHADYASALGPYSEASGVGAVAIGGTNSTDHKAKALADGAVAIAGGSADGAGAVVIGGGRTSTSHPYATGADSVAIGGNANQAWGINSQAWGYNARARYFGGQALGGGDTGTFNGTAQTERVVQRKTTTDATTTALEFDANAAANGYLTLPANMAAAVIVHVVGRQSTTGDSIALRLEGVVHTNGSGVPSLVGTPPAAVDLGHSAGAASWTAALAIDGTNNALLVNVTGEAAKTIKWVARIELVEVGA